MKLQIPAMLLILGIGFTACNSDRNSGDTDSLMTDSALMDTAGTESGFADTTNIDSLSQDGAN